MIDLLSAMTIAQGAIAGTAANVARTRYYEKLAKLEIKEDLQSPLFGSDFITSEIKQQKGILI